MRTFVLLVAFLVCAFSADAFATTAQASSPDTNSPNANAPASSGIAYTVTFTTDAPDSPLIGEMETNSQLLWLRDEKPDSPVALERRVATDLDTARKILRSQGYYNGTASRSIDWNVNPVLIHIQLDPGPRTSIGSTEVIYHSTHPAPPRASPDAPPFTDQELFPRTLAPFGLKTGDPATAEAVLAAVDAISTHLERRGYPLARIASTEYRLIESTHSLRAVVVVDPGPFLRMGALRVQGAPHVSEAYLQRLVPWRPGEPWNAARIEKYRTALQETGLFSMITLKPDQTASAADGLTPVLLTATEAPPRTVSGGVRYSTDNGFGVSGAWEHRNFFGAGERLRIFLPLTEDLQMLSLSFTKPEFGRHDQNLVAEAEARNETTDAYDQTAAYAAIGVERRLSGDWRHWRVSARLSAEGGELDDHTNGRKNYALFGIPLGVRRDTTNDLFNPTQGTRLALSVTPYTGFYDGSLSMVRTRVDASGYLAPTASDRLVLAARAAVGSLIGANADNIPASLRFYTGGGGSVRGYEYQSIGPKNRDGNPAGGLSFTDIGLEARFRVGENFGIVPFLDGGMVYDKTTPKFGKDLHWGAGLGFRYYTPIGPVRLDLAVPLQDQKHQKAFQVYLSIGQAF